MSILDRYEVLFGPIGEQPVGELVPSSIEYGDILNAPGACDVSLSLEQPTNGAGASLLTRENCRTRRTMLWVLRDTQPVWAGPIWGRNTDPVGETLTFTARGTQSYFRRRYFRTDKTWTGIDQLTIFREMIDHAQAVSGGNIGVTTTDTNTSGVTRTRTFVGTERKQYAEAFEQLAAVNDGFDFRFEPVKDPTTGDLSIAARATYPATGRMTNFVFEHGTNCTITDIDEDGDTGANDITATGAGEGASLLLATAADTPALDSEPLLEAITSYTDVTVQGTLDDHAARDLVRFTDDELVMAATLHPGTEPVLGAYLPGDRARVIYSDPYETIDRTMRIWSRGVSVQGGAETRTVGLGPVDPIFSPDLLRDGREVERRLAELERARRATP